MKEFSRIFVAATAAVPPEAFHLPIDGGPRVFRERVYCYELYHQVRRLWPRKTRYRFDGEVDKSGHPKFEGIRAKPDFLVHRPGFMEGNYAIIEVKSSETSNKGIKKDLKTLSHFVSRGYKRAILLVFGENAANVLVDKIQKLAAEIEDLAPIELWMHSRVGRPARKIAVLQSAAVSRL